MVPWGAFFIVSIINTKELSCLIMEVVGGMSPIKFKNLLFKIPVLDIIIVLLIYDM